jgi:putative redox protein
MPAELTIHAVHQGGMRVLARNDRHQVLTDYPLSAGEAVEGLTSLELLLASLATCAANSVMALLKRKMQQDVSALEVEARGVRRDEHPMGFARIDLEFRLLGSGLTTEIVVQALQLAEERFCPVWNMLKRGTPIASSFRIGPDTGRAQFLPPLP